MRIKLTVGDWSRDGHNMSEDIYVESTLSGKDLQKAYKKGVKILGVDLNDYCEEYEDNNIPREVYFKIAKSTPSLYRESLEKESVYDDELVGTGVNEFAILWMSIAQAGAPDLVWTIDPDDHENTINIGGYGLFSN